MTALEKAMQDAAASGIQFSRVKTNGLNMHVARKGRGYPLVLLHGWPEFWMALRPIMDRIGGEYDLIVPDLRGCGDTGKPTSGPDKNATAATHADDLKGLLDELGIKKFGIVGGDLGAYVSQAFAQKYQDLGLLSGIMYFCTPYPGLGHRYGQPDHLIEVWYQYFQQLPWAAKLVGSSREACRMYIKHFLDHWSGDNPEVFKEWMDIWVDNFMKNDNIQGGFDWYLSSGPSRRLWLEGRLPKPPVITVPCRFLWGNRDPLIPPAWSDKLGEYFSNFSIEFVDAGHYVHLEVPDLVVKEIREFFTKVAPESVSAKASGSR